MNCILLIIKASALVYVVSAYDFFEGLGQLSEPCFPIHDHSQCSSTLMESYDPPKLGTGQNPPDSMFFLFTPKSKDKAEQLDLCGGGLLPDSTFDRQAPTVVIIHGNGDCVCRTAWMREMKEQLFLKGDYNVILVDWSWGVTTENAAGALNAKVVGTQAAYVMKKIASQIDYDCKKFHFIGHSYGVVVSSYAGKYMKGKCRMGRLTALDAAQAPFETVPQRDRVNQQDALFVDAIHSNVGECFIDGLGEPKPIGHIDFYMNDGKHQYSCYPQLFVELQKGNLGAVLGMLNPSLCSHLQVIQYFKASIDAAHYNNSQMIGVACKNYEDVLSGKCSRHCVESEANCLVVGMDTPLYVTPKHMENRVYWVPTSLKCPYVDHSHFTGLPLRQVRPKEEATGQSQSTRKPPTRRPFCPRV